MARTALWASDWAGSGREWMWSSMSVDLEILRVDLEGVG